MTHTLPMPAEKLIPHRPPMLFTHTLLRREESEAEVLAQADAAQVTESPELFIEMLAQTVAMGKGWDDLLAGIAPRNGMLVAVDSFDFPAATELAALRDAGRFLVRAREEFGFGAVHLISGEIVAEEAPDRVLARGKIKVWEEDDA